MHSAIYNVGMYELYPYFTNDGTVGLYSPQDDDIYHSTYGALTESWEKFVIPARIKDYLMQHCEVKILDICYGIGYNTKTALNVFLSEIEKHEKYFFKKNKKNLKNKIGVQQHIAAIDTDNIGATCLLKNGENFAEIHEDYSEPSRYNATTYTDNIPSVNDAVKNSFINDATCKKNDFTEYKLLIDAVDSDKTLIGLSPFFINGLKSNSLLKRKINKSNFDSINNDDLHADNNYKNKLQQIKKMQSSQIKSGKLIKNEYRLKDEVSIILLQKLLENNECYCGDEIVQKILNDKKYSHYFSKSTINLARSLSSRGSYSINNKRKSTLLHNIYYQYLSGSYKKAQKLQNFAQIALNLHVNDARRFVLSTPTKYNFVFLDAFTPAKCPALWTVEFFRVLYDKIEDNGMILTYSNSAAIRNAFLKSGFYVGKVYNEQVQKYTGTIAVKDSKLIEYNLSQRDMDLISSKAGICYRDENLNLNNDTIIKNRNIELEHSELCSSSKVLKKHKGKKDGNTAKSI